MLLERPCRAEEVDPMPGPHPWWRQSYRRRRSKAVFSATSGKSLHHRKRAACPRASTLNAKACHELALCHP